ncbi:MAG: PLP-dependent transferase [Helicobacteraceae bacterium]|jgi:O-acetylhomoserine (thiol)-lyase|nr:PLP-dependent transferase [Helicobacteraceae bacterium]
MQGFTTKTIHFRRSPRDPFGASRFPIYETAAFDYETCAELNAAAAGKSAKPIYTRISNPTIEDYELRIRALTNALGAAAVGSGMAAIATAVFALVKAGDSVIAADKLFGHTLSFFQTTLANLGVDVIFVDILDLAMIKNAIKDNTRLIFFETLSNPWLEVPDVALIAAIAEDRGIPLVADTTLTPFYFFDAKKFGAHIEVLSSTKFISGGGASLGGLIIDHGVFDWKKSPNLADYYAKVGQFAFIAKIKREIYLNFGAVLSPHSAYLQVLGLETLALRADRACENAAKMAEFLAAEPKIKSVNYPFLTSSPFYDLAKKQFGLGGSILTFEAENPEKFMDALKIIRRATNLQDNKSLIVSPYFVIFPFKSAEEKAELRISPNLMRFSLGIEDFEDLRLDILQALDS